MSTQLLCTFTYRNILDDTLLDIKQNYDIAYDKIFVLKNAEDPVELFCTYNIDLDGYNEVLDKTISVHRKKDTNTLYTINALNMLIVQLNGELDKTFPIPWQNYQNCILVTNGNRVKRIDTELHDIIEL